MANSSIEEEFERLRVRVENLKMSEKAKADFFQSEWNRLCEKEEKEKERQAMLEEKEKERQAMLEEKEKERELELERLKLESERELELKRMEFEERKRQMELERLRLEREANRSAGEGGEANQAGGVRAFGGVNSLDLPHFVDGKDDLDSYLLRFERYATVANWPQTNWATQLSALLRGEALGVYSRLSQEDALDYERLKAALLERYDYTEKGYRQRFREAKPEGAESPDQFIVRLRNYFTQWVKLSDMESSFEGVVELMVKEQFINACPKELSVHLMESKHKDLRELAASAGQYLTAHNRKLSSRDVSAKKSVGAPRLEGKIPDISSTTKGNIKCFNCGKVGHRASECFSKIQERNPKRYCYRCGGMGHTFMQCEERNRLARGGAGARERAYKVACAVPIKSFSEIGNEKQKEENYRSVSKERKEIDQKSQEYLELKDGRKIGILNGACLDENLSNQMPTSIGMVGNKSVTVLRDTGCSGVIVKRELVAEEQLTGKVGYIMTVARTLLKAPFANVEINTPYCSGTVEALCLRDPLYPLIVGNIPGARAPDDPDETWCVEAAAVTRSQAKRSTESKPLKVAEATNQMAVTKDELIKLQGEDPSLLKYVTMEAPLVKNGREISYIKRKGILYRITKNIDVGEKELKQILVPKDLRKKVMEIAHDTMLAGHMGVKKTEDRILTNFYWPGIHQDVASFCRSCDVCQRTVSKGRVAKVPLGKMPLMDLPFKRVAVDLIGPIMPASDKGHRYVLTLVDYATRYPEAVPLKNIDTETVAEALLDLYSRIGIPEEVLSDLGTQFVSECMQEVSRLLSIRRLTTTPYHPICNGLTEKFNGTLKKMLRRLCVEQPKQWYRFINPLLFAYREVPQASTGFSPFELLYGHTVRGPMAILKELWTGESESTEVKTSYQYVLELRERLEETMKLAQEELTKNQTRYKRNYDKKTKDRLFNKGDKVLVMLPTNNNKLLMQWKGPYEIIQRMGDNGYKILVGNKEKNYHANMLKKYYAREDEVKTEIEKEDLKMSAGAEMLMDEEMPSIDEDSLLELGTYKQKEDVSDVKLGTELGDSQSRQLQALMENYADVFSDVPGRTSKIEHRINLVDEEPVRLKPYPLPYALRQELKEEIKEMLDMGVIRKSSSPYASPVVIVKKKDGLNRICVDYRKLNKVTISDPEPMRTSEDLFQQLGKSKFFSKIDLSKGYWQIPVAEEDIFKTAFVTPDGTYEFLRMPFGMKNSGATLVRGMREVLSGMSGVESYIDDLIVFSRDWETHLRTLEELLKRLSEANLTARPSKCIFGASTVEFLGHDVGYDWITPNDDNLEKIARAKRPVTKKEVRSFCGLLGYYRDYIPSFAIIAAPLTDLTKKGQPNFVKWGEAQEKAFNTLREALLKRPILRLPDHSRNFTLRTDASNSGIGAVLMQEHEGKLHPVAYASKKLTNAETKYSTLEKECLAIIWGVGKFRLFLAGKKFVLQTDHKPLTFLSTARYKNDRILRWSLSLQGYDFVVKDIAGKENVMADYLSRIIV